VTPQIIAVLHAYPKIQLTEAYTGNYLNCVEPRHVDLALDRIAEVRFRAGEMPEVFYETSKHK